MNTTQFTLSQWMISILLAILIGLESFTLTKVKFKNVDKAALIIIGAYNLCMATKMISLIVYGDVEGQKSKSGKNVVDILNMATDITIWFMLYYFIFQMRAVADLVSSGSSEEF